MNQPKDLTIWENATGVTEEGYEGGCRGIWGEMPISYISRKLTNNEKISSTKS